MSNNNNNNSNKKRELEETVSRQQAELARYKTRLADLVTAHKCLLKEKDVLKASLQALSSDDARPTADAETLSSTEASAPQTDEEEKEEESARHLKSKLNTLMNSIATLSEEKSRMEAGFQSDKRQLRAEKLQLENTVGELNAKLEQEAKAHSAELENLKAKLVVERHQREKEHNDHGVMIRELQKVVAEERGKREKAESCAEALKCEVSAARDAAAGHERRIKDLLVELARATARMEQDRRSSSAAAETLQRQLEQLKIQHVLATTKEQERAQEAEERAKNLAAVHEERVANLEARLAELSHTVGSYDRLRHNDQIAIDKLKERLLQLEMEHGDEKVDANIDDLTQSLKQIAKQLQFAHRESEKQLNIKALIMEVIDENYSGVGDGGQRNEHAICQKEYEALKLEFDNYRKQFFIQQSSSPSMRSEAQQAEVDALKSQASSLKDRIRSLHDQIESMKTDHKNELESKHQALIMERLRNRENVGCLELEWRERMMLLEMQLSKQRERALAVVAEKEHEIAQLRECSALLYHHQPLGALNKPAATSISPPSSPTAPNKADGSASGDTTEEASGGAGAVAASSSSGANPMLHYSQEVARRDVELSRLRRENHRLETDLRAASALAAHNHNKIQELGAALDQQLERFKRCQSLKGANLEYLKNVVLSFLLSNDANCKKHMLNAIAAVLKFTDQERKKIAKHSWWYNTASLHFDFVTTL